MRQILSKRWRHEHWRALRMIVAIGSSVAVVAALSAAAVAASTSSGQGFGDQLVGHTYANGILLPTQQWIKPIGTRAVVIKDGRMVSSAISPNGQYLAALTWSDFTGYLTIIDLKTGKVIQQVGTGAAGNPYIGDGTVAADGPLWSATARRCGSRSLPIWSTSAWPRTARFPTRSPSPS